MSSSWFFTGACKKIVIEGEIGGKGGLYALPSREEANNREKAREVYCP